MLIELGGPRVASRACLIGTQDGDGCASSVRNDGRCRVDQPGQYRLQRFEPLKQRGQLIEGVRGFFHTSRGRFHSHEDVSSLDMSRSKSWVEDSADVVASANDSRARGWRWSRRDSRKSSIQAVGAPEMEMTVTRGVQVIDAQLQLILQSYGITPYSRKTVGSTIRLPKRWVHSCRYSHRAQESVPRPPGSTRAAARRRCSDLAGPGVCTRQVRTHTPHGSRDCHSCSLNWSAPRFVAARDSTHLVDSVPERAPGANASPRQQAPREFDGFNEQPTRAVHQQRSALEWARLRALFPAS